MKDQSAIGKTKLKPNSLWLGLRSQYVSDALRNTITIIIPFAVFFLLGYPAAAIAIGTGTLLISPTDLPGNRSDKKKIACIALLVFVLTGFLMAITFNHILLLAVCIFSLTFIFAMLSAFGQQMATIGVMATILATFTIGLRPAEPWLYVLYITIGGVWYFLISILQVWIFPYYPLQRALLKCRKNTASLMRLRAIGYDTEVSLSGFNAKNIRLHIKLTADHELIRRLLLGDKWAEKHRDNKSRQLLHQSLVLIDLYEKVSAVHHDYTQLRELFKDSGALPLINFSINILADIIEGKSSDFFSVTANITQLEIISNDVQEDKLLKKLVYNLKETVSLISSLNKHWVPSEELQLGAFQSFLPTSSFSLSKLKLHFNFKSPVFRFAARVSLLILLSIVFIYLLPVQNYGYWLPLTLIIVSRPSYGMTRKRNWERFIGTVIGLVVSWVLLKAELDIFVQLAIVIVFLFIFFSFFFVRYWVSTLSITISVVLCLSMYHGNVEHIFFERFAFTLLGCMLGIIATFIFPIWHSNKIGVLVDDAISSNLAYLIAVDEMTLEKMNSMRLARKQSYLSLSTFNEAVVLSSSEPFWKRRNLVGTKQVELLSFQLNALIGAYSLSKVQGNNDYDQAAINEVIEELEFCSQIGLPDDISIIEIPLGKLSLDSVSKRLKKFYISQS